MVPVVAIVVGREDEAEPLVEAQPAGQLPERSSGARAGAAETATVPARSRPRRLPPAPAPLVIAGHVVIAALAAHPVHVDGQAECVRRQLIRSPSVPIVIRSGVLQLGHAHAGEHRPGIEQGDGQLTIHLRRAAPARSQPGGEALPRERDRRAHALQRRALDKGHPAIAEHLQARFVAGRRRRRASRQHCHHRQGRPGPVWRTP